VRGIIRVRVLIRAAGARHQGANDDRDPDFTPRPACRRRQRGSPRPARPSVQGTQNSWLCSCRRHCSGATRQKGIERPPARADANEKEQPEEHPQNRMAQLVSGVRCSSDGFRFMIEARCRPARPIYGATSRTSSRTFSRAICRASMPWGVAR
jgi:hypothetical protein